MTTVKAIRATIKLGDIDIDVFQLPDGSYGYGYAWIASLIQKDKSILSDKKSIWGLFKLSNGIIGGTLTNQKVNVDGITYVYLTSEQLMVVLGGAVSLDPEPFLPLLTACAIEALERRSDNAFGVKRTEEQRNQFLKARMEGKCVRRTLTDSIKEYINRHPELSESYSRFVYSNCTDCVNLVVLGAKSKQVKVELDLKPTGLLRDVIPYATLREIEAVEVLSGRLIDAEDLEPLEACKKALQLIHARTLGYGQ
jgi:hypothetical protein